MLVFFLFKQKTAYDMRISDWSSDVCSSDLLDLVPRDVDDVADRHERVERDPDREQELEQRQRRVEPEGLERVRDVQREERSEERRVGKECGCTGRSRRAQYHQKKK